MAWIILVVALALSVGLLIITFGYRTSFIVLLATLGLGIVVVIWYAEFYEGSRSNLISVEAVGVDNFSVRNAYGGSYEMVARLRNNSTQFELAAVGLELSALDCTTDAQTVETCVIVGQQEDEIQIRVPMGQARDVKKQFIFPPMRPMGDLTWKYSILYTKAQK